MKNLLVSFALLVCTQAHAATPAFDCSTVKADAVVDLYGGLSEPELESLENTCRDQADELLKRSKESWLPSRGLHFAERANAAEGVALNVAQMRLNLSIEELGSSIAKLKRDVDAVNGAK